MMLSFTESVKNLLISIMISVVVFMSGTIKAWSMLSEDDTPVTHDMTCPFSHSSDSHFENQWFPIFAEDMVAYRKITPPSQPELKLMLTVDASLAAWPYHQNTDMILKAVNTPIKRFKNHAFRKKMNSWCQATTLAQSVQLRFKNENWRTLVGASGCIFHRIDNLVAYLFHNTETQQVRIIFSGSVTGRIPDDKRDLPFKNTIEITDSWKSNFKDTLKENTPLPEIFLRASELVSITLSIMAENSCYKHYKLSLSGHSLGALLAIYASSTQRPPPRVFCFSCPEIGQFLSFCIGEDVLSKACQYIMHYRIKGDPISHPRKKGKNQPLTHYGQTINIPHLFWDRGPDFCHDKFARCIRKLYK
ncbi:hypothetical protein CI610_01889 [invertebrate metagenome]|uniref:Uncharacterized protein n=1 Tax=invertebrate metagenome TaxID=1711999 RepID=A0A2H9T7D3_9ZZZZ